jgi:hypothetical protein
MMMLAVILLVWTRASQAALEITVRTYELDASLVERWPLGDVGTIVFRKCDACEQIILAVDSTTQYKLELSGSPIGRDELLRVKSALADPAATYVYISYRVADDTATRIVLDAD